MFRILIFGGTTEGRMLAEFCAENKISAHISVATAYGASLVSSSRYLKILIGKLDSEEIFKLISKGKYSMIIDATHPYALEVTKNICTACKKTETAYYRLIRRETNFEYGEKVAGMAELVSLLNKCGGNILSTLGSKEIPELNKIKDFQNRIWFRILPGADVEKYCLSMGISKERLILEKGPFSEEQNMKHIAMAKAEILVTKESGAAGGYPEKVSAARKSGIRLITISRPAETGLYFNEIVEILERVHIK